MKFSYFWDNTKGKHNMGNYFKAILAWVGLLLFTTQITAQNPASSICKFKNNANGAYNIIHDDYGDRGVDGIWQYADTICYNRGIKFTIGAISNSCEELRNVNGQASPYAYAKNVMIPLHGHEIMNHSHTHDCAVGNAGWSPCDMAIGWGQEPTSTNFNTQLVTSTNSIFNNTGYHPRYFIFPYDRFTDAANDKLKELGYIGSRTGWTSPAPGDNSFYRNGYDNFDNHDFYPDVDGFFRTAVMVKASDLGSGQVTANEMDYWAQYAADNGVWVNRELHNVGSTGWGHITVANYRSHINFLKQKVDAGALWIGTISEILTYQIQKLNYTPTTSWNSSSKIITVNWNNPSFDVATYLQDLQVKSPITLKVDVSNAVHAGTYQISQNSVAVTDFYKEGNFLFINVYPHQGPVEILVNNCASICINTQPNSQTIEEGNDFDLAVVATGASAIAYQWYKNNQLISGATTSTLSFTNATLNDAGTYHVVVSNAQGTLTSANAIISVNENPCLKLCFSQHPQSVSTSLGQNVTLTSATQGILPISYQWYFNDVLITGATNSSYDITNAQQTNAGSYKVVATNTSGSKTSNLGVLQVDVQTPYTGSPIAIPGIVQAENFDNGGQNIAYFETSTNNEGDAGAYRSTQVDIENCSEGGYNIGYTTDGEWLEYTVDVAGNGNYNFAIRYASQNYGQAKGVIRMELDGATLFTTASMNFTASWQSYTNYNVTNIPLTGGQHILRMFFVKGDVNVNYVNVTAASLITPTIAFSDLTKTYGDANFNLSASSASSGAFTYSLVNASPAAIVNITSSGNVTINGAGAATIQVNQAAATGYNSSSKTMVLTVNKKDLTITAVNKVKNYKTSNPTLTMSYLGFVNGDTQSNISIPNIATTATINSNAGTYAITLSGGSALNYNLILQNGVLTVNKINLTISADNQSMEYKGTMPTLTMTYNGFASGENSTSISVPQITTLASSTANAGTYEIALSNGAAVNYNLILVNGVFTITKKQLQITADNKSITYGDAIPTLTMTFSGFAQGDSEANISLPTISSSANNNSNVGAYSITLVGGSAQNYQISLSNAILTINKATLTITADDKQVPYGNNIPTLTYSYSGFVKGQNESVVSSPAISTTAINGSPVGSYPITLSGGSALNYNLVLVNGELVVGKKQLTVIAENKTMTYGSSVPSFTLSYNGFLSGDNETNAFTVAPIASSSASSTSNAGTYMINISNATSTKYTFVYQTGVITVNKRDVTVTANNASVTYGDAFPNFTYTVNGLVNNDQSSVVSGISLSTIATTSSDVGNYDINVSGGRAQNYNIIPNKGTLNISQANLTITATDLQKEEGDANPTFLFNYVGFKNGDNKTVLDALPDATTSCDASSPIGDYAIETICTTAKNYAITCNDGTLKVVEKTNPNVDSNTDELLTTRLKLYPNPSNGIFEIEDPTMSVSLIEVMDRNGVNVFIADKFVQKVDLSSLAKGIYFVKLYNDEGNFTVKQIIIQ